MFFETPLHRSVVPNVVFSVLPLTAFAIWQKFHLHKSLFYSVTDVQSKTRLCSRVTCSVAFELRSHACSGEVNIT